jgi:hypothetical protein
VVNCQHDDARDAFCIGPFSCLSLGSDTAAGATRGVLQTVLTAGGIIEACPILQFLNRAREIRPQDFDDLKRYLVCSSSTSHFSISCGVVRTTCARKLGRLSVQGSQSSFSFKYKKSLMILAVTFKFSSKSFGIPNLMTRFVCPIFELCCYLEELRSMSDQFEFVPRFGEEDESYTFVDVGEEENYEADGFLLAGTPVKVENSAVVAHDIDTRTADAATVNVEQKMGQTPTDYGLAPLLIDEIAKGQVWKVSLIVLVLMSLFYDGILHSDVRQSSANEVIARNKGEQVMVQSFELHVGDGMDVAMQRDTEPRKTHIMNYYPTALSSLPASDQRSASSNVDQAAKSLSVWEMFHAMEEQNVSLAPSSDSQSPHIPTPRPTSIKYTTALSILTPHRIVSRLEGAPQPVQRHAGMMAQQHWQPAFIPVRSLIPFAAPRPSPVPDRQNMKPRMVPVPSTRAKVMAGRTPSLNETDTTNIISEMSDSATAKVEPSPRPAIKRNIAPAIDYASDELTQDTFNEFVHQYNLLLSLCFVSIQFVTSMLCLTLLTSMVKRLGVSCETGSSLWPWLVLFAWNFPYRHMRPELRPAGTENPVHHCLGVWFYYLLPYFCRLC